MKKPAEEEFRQMNVKAKRVLLWIMGSVCVFLCVSHFISHIQDDDLNNFRIIWFLILAAIAAPIAALGHFTAKRNKKPSPRGRR